MKDEYVDDQGRREPERGMPVPEMGDKGGVSG